MARVVMIAGHFNPVHIGHINLINHAKQLGDYLIVAVCNDIQAGLKRNKIFIPAVERAAIVGAIKGVDEVIITKDTTSHISETLKNYKPDIFANGCDENHKDLQEEMKVCKKLGIQVVLNVGGPKIRNSSDILNNYYA